MNYKNKLRAIDTFIFDVDGVLTNGLVHLIDDQMCRSLNSKDAYAIQYARKMNYKIFIITGGDSIDIQNRLLELGATEVRLKSHNKVAVYNDLKEKYQLVDEHVLYMGDDIPDIPLLKMVGLAACPADSSVDVLQNTIYQSPLKGGEGCVREIMEQVMRVQEKWMKDLAFEW
jgi:3-deoxy-D-manno-octulosonate 8-phosphate phosphatase (KDO 8-P phosphatase)